MHRLREKKRMQLKSGKNVSEGSSIGRRLLSRRVVVGRHDHGPMEWERKSACFSLWPLNVPAAVWAVGEHFSGVAASIRLGLNACLSEWNKEYSCCSWYCSCSSCCRSADNLPLMQFRVGGSVSVPAGAAGHPRDGDYYSHIAWCLCASTRPLLAAI